MIKSNRFMLIYAIITILLIAPSYALSDPITWYGTDPGDIYYNNGNVGIGTASPGAKLEIFGTDDSKGLLYVHSSEGGLDGTLIKLSAYSYINQDSAGSSYWTWGARYNGNSNAWTRTYTGELPLVNAVLTTSGDFIIQTDPNTSGDPSWQSRFIVNEGGNVGIGTTAPGSKLHIKESTASDVELRLETTGPGNDSILRIKNTNTAQGAQGAIYFDDADTTVGRISYDHNSGGVSDYMRFYTNNSHAMTIDNNGNVGIGTTSPNQKLDVNGIIISSASNPAILLGSDSSTWSYINKYSVSGDLFIYNKESGKKIYFGTANTTRMTIDGLGNVGIGTTSPQSKLAVNGTITTKEVNVTETGWSDFVFEDDYTLPSLDHVETFIKENKHLPDIPSSDDIEANGLPMAEMMAKQMQKIEELTLYVIEQNKRLDQVVKENQELRDELAELNNMN